MEQQLKKLLTDDPSVVEATLEKCAEAAHPEKTGVIRRFVFLNSRDKKLIPCIFISASKVCFVPFFLVGSSYLKNASVMTQ